MLILFGECLFALGIGLVMKIKGKILSLVGLLCISFSVFALVTDCPAAEYLRNNSQLLNSRNGGIIPGLGEVAFSNLNRNNYVGDWIELFVFSDSRVVCLYDQPGDTPIRLYSESAGWKPHDNGPPWIGRRCTLSRTACQVSNT
jgi:hypothetical protein